ATEPYNSAHLKTHIGHWAENALSELKTEVRGAAARLQELVERINSPQVRNVAELYERNRNLLDLCKGTADLDLGGAGSCINITEDIANITALFFYGYQLGYDLSVAVIRIVTELNSCSTKPIWKKWCCYKNAIQDIQNTIKVYSLECSQFVQNATNVIQHIEIDISKCFSFTESISGELFEKRIELCKLEFD
ncbi:hypothetical protein J6590_092834, partial [Homalodisca vitripennis]